MSKSKVAVIVTMRKINIHMYCLFSKRLLIVVLFGYIVYSLFYCGALNYESVKYGYDTVNMDWMKHSERRSFTDTHDWSSDRTQKIATHEIKKLHQHKQAHVEIVVTIIYNSNISKTAFCFRRFLPSLRVGKHLFLLK